MTKSQSKTVSKTGSSATGRGKAMPKATKTPPSPNKTSTTGHGKATDVEITTPLIVDDSWSFKYNDERITYEQHLANEKAHKEWVAALLKSAELEEEPVRRRKKK